MTLTEFLLARIAEDDDAAREAVRWNEGCRDWADAGEPDWVHIARWDPARVLAECEAKRQIIAEYDGLTFEQRSVFDHWEPYRSVMRNVLHHMASPYADHPDFQPEWLTASPDR